MPERAQRRTFTAKYKLAILQEYERAERTERGALLRRENLYSSLPTEWHHQRDRGALDALSSRRGPKAGKPAGNAAKAEIARACRVGHRARGDPRAGGTVRALGEALGRHRQQCPGRQRALRMIELLKRAPLVSAMADALRARGVDETTARLAAEMGVLAFSTAYPRWAAPDNRQPFTEIAHAALQDLHARATALDISTDTAPGP